MTADDQPVLSSSGEARAAETADPAGRTEEGGRGPGRGPEGNDCQAKARAAGDGRKSIMVRLPVDDEATGHLGRTLFESLQALDPPRTPYDPNYQMTDGERYVFERCVTTVLNELAAGRPEKAIVAVEKRREELTRTSWVCIEALAHLQRYVSEFCGELL